MNDKKAWEIDTDGWQCIGPYEFVRVGGWTITNCIISGKSVWQLRQASTEHGNYKSAEEAMRQHAELSAALPIRPCIP
jgi:hypothetical protein